jgi:hypothetical protein
MQIHELTQRKKVDEGILDKAKAVVGKVGAGIQGAKTGYKSGQISRQTADIAKKAWSTWQVYADQLQKQYAGDPKFAKIYREQLLAFVQKNLLRGAHLPNLINKDEIVGLVDQLTKARTGTDVAASNAGAGKPPANTSAAAAPAGDAQTAAPATPTKIEAGKEVALGNEHYRWLGAQWAVVNPKTGKTGKTAEKAVAPELTKMAQAGKFVQPFTSPDAGALSPDQAAANAAAGKKAGPYGFDTATGKPLPKPGTGVRMGTAPKAKPGQMSADVAASKPGQDLQKMFGTPKGGIQGMPSDLEENRFKDLDKKLREAVYKAKANNPNATDQNPYVQGRAGDGTNPTQFAKFNPATSTTANATQGINTMAAGGQAARDAAKPAKPNPAQEKQLFDKLVNASVLSANKVATGQPSADAGTNGQTAGGDQASGEDPYQLVPNVQQQEKAEAGVDSATLKKVGNVIRNNYTSGNPGVRKTGEPGVDALLLAMGFQV